MTKARPSGFTAATLLLAAVIGFGGCSSGSGDSADSGAPNDSNASCTDGGGPVPGDADRHCTDDAGSPIVQETSAAACMDPGADDGAGGAGAGEEEEELVLFNAEGDDDDCKYHVSFSTTCVERDKDVTFTVHASNRGDDSPLVGADPQTEIYLDDSHVAPNTQPKTTVVSPGVYRIGPVRFDEPGRWSVRFHFFETCLDGREDSPHGHAAFYLDVP